MQLHDILPPIEVTDYTLFYVLISMFFIIGLLYLLVKRFVKKDENYYLNMLENCDFEDGKKTAFQFSYYGKTAFKNEDTKEKYLSIKQKITKYKYTKNSSAILPHIEEEIKKLIKQQRDYND